MSTPKISTATASRNATIAEMNGGTVGIHAGFKLTLPQVGGKGNQIKVKALGHGCQIQSADGIDVGADGGTGSVPTTSTSAITLRQGESVELTRFGGALGDKWIQTNRSCPTDALALGQAEVQAVGTGDGSTVNFDLGHDEVTDLQVWVNGTIQAATAYSISAGAGTGGVDRLVFGTAPTSTHPIIAAYRRKTRVG